MMPLKKITMALYGLTIVFYIRFKKMAIDICSNMENTIAKYF